MTINIVVTTITRGKRRMSVNNEQLNGMFQEGHINDVLWFKRQYLRKNEEGDE